MAHGASPANLLWIASTQQRAAGRTHLKDMRENPIDRDRNIGIEIAKIINLCIYVYIHMYITTYPNDQSSRHGPLAAVAASCK